MVNTVKQFIIVGTGGAIGSILRYGCNLLFPARNFPAATFAVNIIGSFVIGMVIAYSIKNESASNWKLFIATGICGGFTTFSAFTIENLLMLQNGKWMLSIAYISFSILLGIIAAWAGYKLIH